jgi:methanethiol S-methyltransferase
MGTLYIILASVLWGGLHSWTASLALKGWARGAFGETLFKRWYRFGYNIFALISFAPIGVLAIILPDRTLYSIPEPWIYVTLILQFLALVGLTVSILRTNPLDFIGLHQMLTGEEGPAKLVTTGLYRVVRHPLYAGGLILMWLTSHMTLNLLTLYLCITLYLFVGARFEERKLLREFGQAYTEYKARTPMMIPFIKM